MSLLAHAVRTTRAAADLVAVRALIVDPTDADAAAFYARYDFRPFPATESDRMFLPL